MRDHRRVCPALRWLHDARLQRRAHVPVADFAAGEARKAQAAAAAKAQQDAINAKKLEEERAKQEEEKAKQAEKKRLEEEAAKAREWREKVENAQKEGPDYAKANDLNWTLDERTNPMTDEPDYTVWSLQRNRTGALARVEGRIRSYLERDCPMRMIQTETIWDLFNRGRGHHWQQAHQPRTRIRDELPAREWANQILVSQLVKHRRLIKSADETRPTRCCT